METKAKNRALNPITLPNYEFIIKSEVFKKEGEEFTIWFLEGVLEKNPDYIDCLVYLGNAYTAHGMYEKGLQIDMRLCSLRPKDPLIHYNLACSYALLKNSDAALDALEKAIILGYDNIQHLEMDEDLASLRENIRYKMLVKKIKQH